MSARLIATATALLLVSAVNIPLLHASWEHNGAPVCSESGSQYAPQLITSGPGSAIITWHDLRSGNSDIYAQEIDANGITSWQSQGVPVCTAAGNQYNPMITYDASGGAIIAWRDRRAGNYDIYAQRINGSGNVQWASDGVPVCTAVGDQSEIQIIADLGGGAIICWQDQRGSSKDIYAQRIDSNGSTLWAGNGVAICSLAEDQNSPQIMPTSSGGAFIAWHDSRGTDADIYAQMIDATGAAQWTANGIVVCAASGSQYLPQITHDGSDGMILAWRDLRGGVYDIYVQRINGTGIPQWTADGVAICTATGSQTDPAIHSDGAQGAYLTWVDRRSGNYDIYTQRINSSGAVQWTANGVAVCTDGSDQEDPRIEPVLGGGAIITWFDDRNGQFDIFAQQIDPAGSVQWTTDGIAVCAAMGIQADPQLASLGIGGAMIVWYDDRSGGTDIYAQTVDGSGTLLWTDTQVHIGRHYNDQTDPGIAYYGDGGAIIAFADERAGNRDIYVQKIDRHGNILWRVGGVAVCTATGNQTSPQIIPDEAGGAIVVWMDYRTIQGNLYAQRIDADGIVLWSTNGVDVTSYSGPQSLFDIARDGSSGVVIVWTDNSTGVFDVQAQRISAAGTVLWTLDGITVCGANDRQENPQIVYDGSSTVLISWADDRGVDKNIYAQKLDLDGNPQWAADGFAVCTESGVQQNPVLASDGSGGAVIAWSEPRLNSDDIFAQRVTSNEAKYWTAKGQAICIADGSQINPSIIPGDPGGAIIAWSDYRSGSAEIFVQKIGATATHMWTLGGVDITTLPGNQLYHRLVSDGMGGVIVTWVDTQTSVYDIYAQRIDVTGNRIWSLDEGVAVCVETGMAMNPAISTDGSGGAIITWHDESAPGTGNDIYANSVNSDGTIKVPILLESFTAHVFSAGITLRWTLAAFDESMEFVVMRTKEEEGTFREIPSPHILHDGSVYSFTDSECIPGNNYRYRVDLVDGLGRSILFETESLSIPAGTAVLFQNHPNPFNPTTSISFHVPADTHVRLTIYNVEGKLVRVLLDDPMTAGLKHAAWDGKNSNDETVGSGVYLYQLQAGKIILTKKMVLVK